MKSYSVEVLNELQNVINKGSFSIKEFETPESLPHSIYISGCKTTLLDGDTKDAIVYCDFSLSTEYSSKWKKLPLGHFYNKDWKRHNKGEENYKKYLEIHLSVKNINVVALVREINVEEDDDYYNELSINDKAYCIIKMYIEDIESYNTKSLLDEFTFSEKLTTQYSLYIDENDEETEDEQDNSEEEKSEELF